MPAASDPSAALGVPAVGEHRRSLLSPGFVLVTAATLFYFVALGALLPTLPVYVEDELGGGSVAVGVTVGVFAVSAALLRPLAGRLGDTRGRRILVIGGSLVMGLSVLAYTLVDSIAALVALRLLTGAGEAAMWVGAATAIQDMAPDDRRGEAASYFSVALYAGLAFGPLVGEGLRDSAGFHAVWIFAGCCGLVACALGFGTPRDVRREPQPFRLLHPAALGPGAILLLGMLPFIGFATFIALYGPTVGFADVAPLLLVYGVLVLVIRVVGAKLPDQLGWTRASSTALSVLAVGGLLLGLWSGTAGVWLGDRHVAPLPGPVQRHGRRGTRIRAGSGRGHLLAVVRPGERARTRGSRRGGGARGLPGRLRRGRDRSRCRTRVGGPGRPSRCCIGTLGRLTGQPASLRSDFSDDPRRAGMM